MQEKKNSKYKNIFSFYIFGKKNLSTQKMEINVEENNNNNNNMIKQSTDFHNPIEAEAYRLFQIEEEKKKQLATQRSSEFAKLCKQFLAASAFAIGTYVLKNAAVWTFKFLKKTIFGGVGDSPLIIQDADQ